MKNFIKYSICSAAIIVTIAACSNTSTKKDKANNLNPKPSPNTAAAVSPCLQIEIGKDHKINAFVSYDGANEIVVDPENFKFDEATLVSEFNKLDLSKLKFEEEITPSSQMRDLVSKHAGAWKTSRNLTENGALGSLATNVEEGIFYGKFLTERESVGGTVKMNISCDAKNKVIKTLTTDLEFISVSQDSDGKSVVDKVGPQPENEGWSPLRKVIEKEGVIYVVMLSGLKVLSEEPYFLRLTVNKLIK